MLNAATPIIEIFRSDFAAVVYDDGDEDEAEESLGDQEETSKDEFTVKPKDEFAEKPKDEFAEKPKDEFALEKREEEVYEYEEPDIVNVKRPAYLYAENSVDSRKMFELFKGDELIVLEERDDWVKVEFLTKEGWVERDAVSFTDYTLYRIFLDLSVGLSYSPELLNYSVLGTYSLGLFYGVHEYFIPGVECKALSIDTDVLYIGFGGAIRAHIPYLESKRSKTTLSVSGGYFRMPDAPGYRDKDSRSDTILFEGGYFSGAIEHVVRVSDPVYVGGGFEFMYASGTTTATVGKGIRPEFWTVGGRIKVMFNIWE
ncbi:MAG TPA: SH3 domain-containing protein [bacterium]|nr:SH3 domain-containing protein [bacterium]